MKQPGPRNSLIDVMRGISIVLVLIHHFDIAYRLDQGILGDLFSAGFVRAVARNGNYGVIIFFAISGFLITTNSLARFGRLKNLSLRAFYSYRFARIAPNLALILTIVVPLALAGVPLFANKPGTVSLPATVFSVLTFSHNVLMEKVGWFNYPLNILWSLSVEEMFYFTFPLVCVLFRKDMLLMALWIVVAIVSPIYRSHYRHNEMVAMYGYLSCFDGIAIGCMAAVLKDRLRFSERGRYLTRYLAATGIIYIYLSRGIMGNIVLGVSAVALLTGIILLGSADGKSSDTVYRNAATRALCWFGKNSYELYVFHLLVLATVRITVPPATLGYYVEPFWFALYIAFSAVLAGAIARFYSEPMNMFLRSVLARNPVPREARIDTVASV